MTKYGTFDKSTIAEGVTGSDYTYTSTKIPFHLVFRVEDTTAETIMWSRWNLLESTGRSFIIEQFNKKIRFATSVDGAQARTTEIPIDLVAGEICTLIGEYNAGTFTGTINGIPFEETTLDTSVFLSPTAANVVGGVQGTALYKFGSDIFYVKVGENEYTFDDDYGTTTVKDSGASDDLTLSGATLTSFWQTDYSGLREVKDGYGVYDASALAVNGSDSVATNRDVVPFELIFKPDALTGIVIVAGKGHLANTFREASFGYNGTKFYANFSESDFSFGYVQSATSLKANDWNVITGVFDNGTVNVIINGVEESLAMIGTASTIYQNPNADLAMGGADDGSNKFEGAIAHFKYGDVSYNYTDGSGTTIASSGVLGMDATISNYYDGFWQDSDAKLVESNCAKFDGIAYGIENDRFTAGEPFTIEGYHKADNVTEYGIIFGAANDDSQAIAGSTFTLVIHTSAFLGFNTWNGDCYGIPWTKNTDEHYLKAYFDPNDITNCRLWVDGVEQSLSQLTGTPVLTGNYKHMVVGGKNLSTLWKFEGLQYGLKVDESEDYPLAEGSGAYMYGSEGGKLTITNATLSDFWSERQDTLHYNILNGFDCYQNDNNEIKMPIGTEPGVGFVQCGTTEYLDDNENGGLTENSQLEWSGSEINNFNIVTVGGGTVTEVSNGTRIYCPTGDTAYFSTENSIIEAGKTYNYYLKVEEVASGSIDLRTVSGIVAAFTSPGVYTGQLSSVSNSVVTLRDSTNPSDAVVSEFYIWEDGTLPNFSPTNPAGKWHNGAETGIQFPESMQAIQDSVPITSLTRNAQLRWVDGELEGFDLIETGASTVTEVANGTRLLVPSGDITYISGYHAVIETGKTYNVYARMSEYVSGSAYVSLGGATLFLTSGTGVVTTGTITAISDTNYARLASSGAVVDLVVDRFYVWEEGTIPPLFYDEFESDFNEKHQVFSNIEEKKKRGIVFYNTPISGDELAKVNKCIGANIWNDENTWDDTKTWTD